jgi:hypothetical protein
MEEVLTLQEAASFLRVSVEALSDLAERHAVPAQNIAGEWRFLRRALAGWLASGSDFRRFPPWAFEYPPFDEIVHLIAKRVLSEITPTEKPAKRGSKEAIQKHFGVWRDDPTAEVLLADIYQRRESEE